MKVCNTVIDKSGLWVAIVNCHIFSYTLSLSLPAITPMVMSVETHDGSRLPELQQTVLGVGADEVLMWMMNNTDDVFLMNL